MKTLCTKIWDQGGIVTTATNIPYQIHSLRENFPYNFQLVDNVMYKDLDLIINGNRVFKTLEGLHDSSYITLTQPPIT